MTKPIPETLNAYVHFLPLQTRWADNDVYGHVNNAVYYFYFDTLVNDYLIKNGVLKINHSQIIGLVVETGCSYFEPVAFPDKIVAGLRVAHIGNSSVRYEIGLFRNAETTACAQGHFVHVYVDNRTRTPEPIKDGFRAVLDKIKV